MVKDPDFLPSKRNRVTGRALPLHLDSAHVQAYDAVLPQHMPEPKTQPKPEPKTKTAPVPATISTTDESEPKPHDTAYDSQRSSLIDYYPIVYPLKKTKRPVHARPSAPTPGPMSEPSTKSKLTKRKFLSGRNVLSLGAVIISIIILASGLFVPLLNAPHIGMAIFIACVLIFHLKSRVSFTLALALLVIIPVLEAIGQQALAETYAIYCFYFLVLGIAMTLYEIKRS